MQVYEVGEQPLPYLVMEFIPGETLQQRLDRTGPLDVAEVLRIGRQIAEGLAAAHATDLIHRDIKPANILLEGGPQQRVKITDFGLARAADDASISQSGIIAGTPMYMAPEQAQGDTLDQRADLFSLGSVLYQMVDRPAAVPRQHHAGGAEARGRGHAAAHPRRSSPKRRSGCATSSPSCTPRTRTTASSRREKWPTCSPTAKAISTTRLKDSSRIPPAPKRKSPRIGRWLARPPRSFSSASSAHFCRRPYDS